MEAIEIHSKGWGYEKWIVNTDKYCGKILLRYGNSDDYEKSETITLKPGDKFYVPPGLRHQMTGIKDTELFEFSTQHFEDDSYRIIRGD